jgi:hypothetical protein
MCGMGSKVGGRDGSLAAAGLVAGQVGLGAWKSFGTSGQWLVAVVHCGWIGVKLFLFSPPSSGGQSDNLAFVSRLILC